MGGDFSLRQPYPILAHMTHPGDVNDNGMTIPPFFPMNPSGLDQLDQFPKLPNGEEPYCFRALRSCFMDKCQILHIPCVESAVDNVPSLLK